MSDKQKEKLVNDLTNTYDKLTVVLKDLNDNLLKIENGEDGEHPYWNGSNAYEVLNRLHKVVDKGNVLSDYVKECKDSIK